MKPWEPTLKKKPKTWLILTVSEVKVSYVFIFLVWGFLSSRVIWHRDGINLVLKLYTLLSHWENRDTLKASGNTQSANVKLSQTWSTRSLIASEHRRNGFLTGVTHRREDPTRELVILLLRTSSFERNSAEKWEFLVSWHFNLLNSLQEKRGMRVFSYHDNLERPRLTIPLSRQSLASWF